MEGYCAILRDMPKCIDLVLDISSNWSLSARDNKALGYEVSVDKLEILNCMRRKNKNRKLTKTFVISTIPINLVMWDDLTFAQEDSITN